MTKAATPKEIPPEIFEEGFLFIVTVDFKSTPNEFLGLQAMSC